MGAKRFFLGLRTDVWLFSVFLLAVFPLLGGGVSRVMAVENPLRSENNKVGVHLLSPDEVGVAEKLVNGKGKGEWGYVVVPMQATDRDKVKWEKFMSEAKRLKVIPIVRVATLVESINWEEPNNYDLVDFANFLNDLPWPTKNRYVVLFNEVNRADEFGGSVSPEDYALILHNAIKIFKERSEDFFILPAGLDNAAVNTNEAVHWKTYLGRMKNAVPGIFGEIDGWTSHAYPNPAFRASPLAKGEHSISSYLEDLKFLRQFTSKELPVFITETGWDQESLGERTAAENFRVAFERAWSDPRIVVVAPFLLRADVGPFTKFSLLRKDGAEGEVYKELVSQVKVKGKPTLSTIKDVKLATGTKTEGVARGWQIDEKNSLGWLWELIKKWFFEVEEEVSLSSGSKVRVGADEYRVEIADSQTEWQKGLGGKESLAENEGMLFKFPRSKQTFWMKEMKFDIDIVWIREGKVVGVSQGLASEPKKLIPSPGEIDQALEVRKGSGIKEGEVVTIIQN